MASKKIEYRTETDQLGGQAVPQNAYWGAQTARSLQNGIRIPEINPRFLDALLYFQKALALSNVEQGLLEQSIGRTIGQAVDETLNGQWQDQFVVTTLQPSAVFDIIANVREVLANRSGEILGSAPGTYSIVHPQQHLAAGRNTYEDFAVSLQIALLLLQRNLESALRDLERLLRRKALEFDRSARSGSNGSSSKDSNSGPAHMFNGYGADVAKICRRILDSSNSLLDLHFSKEILGENAVWQNRNQLIVEKLSLYTGLALRLSDESISKQSATDFIEFSSSLRLLAVLLNNMTHDLRSITSANQSAAEFVSLVCHQVIGMDAATCALAQSGQMETSGMLALSANNLLQSIELLKQSLLIFNQRCISTISTSPTLLSV